MAAKILEIRQQLEDELSKIALLNKATEKVKVPFFKAYLVFGIVVLIVLLVAFGVASDFLTDLIGTAYPAFVSLKLAFAFANGDASNDARNQVPQWLTYWVLYAIIDAFEVVFDAIGIPFFDLFKLFFLVWLFLPGPNNAAKIFHFLHPHLGRFFKPAPVEPLSKTD